MFEVISNEILAPNLHKMVVLAPRVALARQAGQFVIVRAVSRPWSASTRS